MEYFKIYLKTLFVVVVKFGFDLSLGFQTADNISVLPSNFMGNTSDLTELAVGSEA